MGWEDRDDRQHLKKTERGRRCKHGEPETK